MHLRSLLLATIAALPLTTVIGPRDAVADTLDIRKADNGVSLDAGETYLDYAETSGGVTADTEKGWLPTVGLGFGMLAFHNAPIPNLYFRLDARASIGSTAYNGALCDQFGFCTPYQSTTNDQIYTGAAQLGRAFELGRAVLLTPFAEIGYRYWSRDLKGIGGYGETYQNWDAMGGLLLQYSPASRWVLSLSGAAGTTFGASVETSGESFPLGSQLIWRTQGKIGYRLSERIELSLSGEYQSFGYGASPVDANGFYEPDSTTHETTLLLGIAYHFF
ncbi:MAG: hypothetical protein ACLQJR_02920 [Stellaceae bacterium]